MKHAKIPLVNPPPLHHDNKKRELLAAVQGFTNTWETVVRREKKRVDGGGELFNMKFKNICMMVEASDVYCSSRIDELTPN